MQTVKFDCDCDRVIEMQEMEIGVGEILQYVQAFFTREELGALQEGVERLVASQLEA